MRTYEPGKLYLIDLDGETHEARYFANGINPPYFQLREGNMTHRDNVTNVRPAIVLDPEDEDVKEFMEWESNFFDGYLSRLAAKIRAQITPPEPPMEEPTEWGAVVQTDRGRAILLDPEDDAASLTWFVEGFGWAGWLNLENPRPHENPRQEPATAPLSDAQGSMGGIGRVIDSDAGERL